MNFSKSMSEEEMEAYANEFGMMFNREATNEELAGEAMIEAALGLLWLAVLAAACLTKALGLW